MKGHISGLGSNTTSLPDLVVELRLVAKMSVKALKMHLGAKSRYVSLNSSSTLAHIADDNEKSNSRCSTRENVLQSARCFNHIDPTSSKHLFILAKGERGQLHTKKEKTLVV